MPAGSYGKSLGMGKGLMDDPEEESTEPMAMGEEEETEEGGDVPPDFLAAYEEYEAAPSAKTLYDAIEACKSGKEPGGLALILGGKGKK